MDDMETRARHIIHHTLRGTHFRASERLHFEDDPRTRSLVRDAIDRPIPAMCPAVC